MTITPQQIADRINGFLLDATSRPNVSTVQDIIDEQTARVEGYLTGKGVPLPLFGGPEMVARGVIIDLCVSKVIESRSRESTGLSKATWDAATSVLRTITTRPSFLGAPSGGRSANVASGAGRRCAVSRRRSVLQSMADEGKI